MNLGLTYVILAFFYMNYSSLSLYSRNCCLSFMDSLLWSQLENIMVKAIRPTQRVGTSVQHSVQVGLLDAHIII